MRTLIIMRHAKTEEGQIGMKDFDRNLTDRGINDAGKMALWIKKKISAVDLILVSPAARTSQTANIIHQVCEGDLNLVESFYHADANDLLSQIQQAKKKIKVLMLVGHNPAVSSLVSFLSNKLIELKPSDAVVFELANKEWDERLQIESFTHHTVYGR